MDKVLLVEDEDIIRRGLLYAVDWLKEDCVVVGEAIDGVDGLEKIDTLRPDIVITDVKMPYLDGLGMLEQSRDRGYEAIILSGYDEFSYAKRAISLDVTEYLLKPVDFDALHESLVRAKERLRRRAETRRLVQEYAASAPVEIFPSAGRPSANIRENFCAAFARTMQSDCRCGILPLSMECPRHICRSVSNRIRITPLTISSTVTAFCGRRNIFARGMEESMRSVHVSGFRTISTLHSCSRNT